MLRSRSALALSLFLAFGLAACEETSAPPTSEASAAGGGSIAAAEAMMKKRELEPAIAMLQGLVAAPDATPLATQRLAECYAAREDLAKSIKVLRAGEQRFPKAPELPFFLARIFQKLQQYPDMRDALDRARAAGGSDKDIGLLYGACLGQLKDMEGAEREFEKARVAGAEAKVVDYNLAVILIEKREYAQAKTLLDSVVAADPKWFEAQRERAHMVFLTSSERPAITEAMNSLVGLREELPNDWRVYEYLGDGSLLLGDFEGAVRMYTESLRLGRSPDGVKDKYVIARRKLVEAVGEEKATAIINEISSAAIEADKAASAPKKP